MRFEVMCNDTFLTLKDFLPPETKTCQKGDPPEGSWEAAIKVSSKIRKVDNFIEQV